MTIYSTMTPAERIHFAIRESIYLNETIKLYGPEDLSREALCESEDSCVESDGSVQYWGTTDDGEEWSLRLYIEGELIEAAS